MSHIFPAPHAPLPKGIGQRSKVVTLPTTVKNFIDGDKNDAGPHKKEYEKYDDDTEIDHKITGRYAGLMKIGRYGIRYVIFKRISIPTIQYMLE